MAERTLKLESKDAGNNRVRAKTHNKHPENFVEPSNFNSLILQHKAECACGGGCPKCQDKADFQEALIQTKLKPSHSSDKTTSALETAKNITSSTGQSLDQATRNFMESGFGYDFGNVAVHTDENAAKAARSVNALAYTYGNHIVFDKGFYSPETNEGQKLLAHELTHVIQQSRGGSSQPSLFSSSASEKEADSVSSAILSGDSFQVSGLSALGIARQPRSLSETVPPSSLSNEELANEIRLIQEWLAANPSSSEEGTILTNALMAFSQEGVRRRPAETASIESSPAETPADESSLPDPGLSDGTVLGFLAPLPQIADKVVTTGRAVTAGEAAVGGLGALATGALAFLAVMLYSPPLNSGEDEMIREDRRREQKERAKREAETQTQTDTKTETEKRRRNSCFEQNPNALACDKPPMDMEEAVVDFIMNEGHDFDNLGECFQMDSFGPDTINACNGAPGQRWHCNVKGSNLPVSIFACLCCNTDGTSGFRWEGPHWSVNQSKRGG